MTSYRYPARGVQNRKAAVAVEVTAIFLDYLAPVMAEWGPGWKDRMRRIARRRQECKQDVRWRNVSAGAKREIREQADALDKYLSRVDSLDKAEAPFFMGALVVASGGLVCDALCTAPVITHKSPDGGCPKPQWAWLNRLMDRLADDMAEMFPGCDELGTQIYMEVSR